MKKIQNTNIKQTLRKVNDKDTIQIHHAVCTVCSIHVYE